MQYTVTTSPVKANAHRLNIAGSTPKLKTGRRLFPQCLLLGAICVLNTYIHVLAQGFQDESSNKTSMKAEELVEILKGENDRKEKDVAQSGVISDKVYMLSA